MWASATAVRLLLPALLLFGCRGAHAGEADEIASLLGLGPGMSVADVGAGDGEWAERLARKVGPEGRVYATEVKDDLLKEIRDRANRAGLGNVETVRGDQGGTGLPPGCCDAILLRMVYHHFEQPERMKASLRSALRPGGRIVVIDTEPQAAWAELPRVPDRGGHGIPLERLVAEMEAGGFKLLERHPRWNGRSDRFGLLFAPGPRGSAESR
jgi:ubiquinone/menaquinone biosynthesis C-methylase UbiE